MAIREFLSYREVCDQLADVEAVRQAILFQRLPAYIELHDCSCTVRSRTVEFPEDGSNPFADWFSCSFGDDPPDAIADGPLAGWFQREYMLRGWFHVDPDSATAIARMEHGDAARVTVLGDRGGGASTAFHPDEHFELADLWFRAADVVNLGANSGSVADRKSLEPRERTTLLCIIGALAAHTKLDLSQPMKAGNAIAAMMPDVNLSGRTIGEHLKAVRGAMDSRKG